MRWSPGPPIGREPGLRDIITKILPGVAIGSGLVILSDA